MITIWGETGEPNQLHKQRWAAARRLAETLRGRCLLKPESNIKIMFDDTIITPDQLVVIETGIYVKIERATYVIFENNPRYDHGLYVTIEKFEAEFRKRFRLIKEIKW